MDYKSIYQEWLNDDFFESNSELKGLDEKEIEDRFYLDLDFGTAGLRGIMGAGTNRMNKFTVGKATLGLGTYLIKNYGDSAKERGVVICYDTRNNSSSFALVTANILSGLGIKVKLFIDPLPTPVLSFAVTHFDCIAGINITASHNPKEYNGYKVYNEFGYQLVDDEAKAVKLEVDNITDYHTLNFVGNPELIELVDPSDDFVSEVCSTVSNRYNSENSDKNIKIVYTPLHGTGKIPVYKALKKQGFSSVEYVKEQAILDGNFTTTVSPNPENPEALKLGIAQANYSGADLVIGTDPDCDRVGIAVRVTNESKCDKARVVDGFQLMTGNQVGALLVDYIMSKSDREAVKANGAMIKTIVTSELGARIFGGTTYSVLTGFKYIGEKIRQFESSENSARRLNYCFGYEESYGYLIGTFAKDKDAVGAALLICELAASLKAEGKTILDRMYEIYNEYGYYKDAQDSFTMQGKDGQAQIQSIMTSLREKGSPFADTKETIDYQNDVLSGFINEDSSPELLPKSNVLKYILNDDSWVAVRPSGTEPKIKFYYGIKADNSELAEKRLDELQSTIKSML